MIWKGVILRPGQTGRAPAAVRKAEIIKPDCRFVFICQLNRCGFRFLLRWMILRSICNEISGLFPLIFKGVKV